MDDNDSEDNDSEDSLIADFFSGWWTAGLVLLCKCIATFAVVYVVIGLLFK